MNKSPSQVSLSKEDKKKMDCEGRRECACLHKHTSCTQAEQCAARARVSQTQGCARGRERAATEPEKLAEPNVREETFSREARSKSVFLSGYLFPFFVYHLLSKG